MWREEVRGEATRGTCLAEAHGETASGARVYHVFSGLFENLHSKNEHKEKEVESKVHVVEM